MSGDVCAGGEHGVPMIRFFLGWDFFSMQEIYGKFPGMHRKGMIWKSWRILVSWYFVGIKIKLFIGECW